jgi:hypothetical protein
MWTMDHDIDGANSQLEYQNALAAPRRGDRVKLATSVSWHTVNNLPRFCKSEAPISQYEDTHCRVIYRHFGNYVLMRVLIAVTEGGKACSYIVYLWQYKYEIREFRVHSVVEKDDLKDWKLLLGLIDTDAMGQSGLLSPPTPRSSVWERLVIFVDTMLF